MLPHSLQGPPGGSTHFQCHNMAAPTGGSRSLRTGSGTARLVPGSSIRTSRVGNPNMEAESLLAKCCLISARTRDRLRGRFTRLRIRPAPVSGPDAIDLAKPLVTVHGPDECKYAPVFGETIILARQRGINAGAHNSWRMAWCRDDRTSRPVGNSCTRQAQAPSRQDAVASMTRDGCPLVQVRRALNHCRTRN